MVIVEGALSGRYLSHKMDPAHLADKDQVALGFGKAAAFILAGYFAIKVMGISVGNHWNLLSTPYGLWFLLELGGFVALPCFLYAIGVREKNLTIIKTAAVWTVLGIVLNRLNVSLVAFNWHLPAGERYFPHWMEIGLSVFLVTVGILVFRFIALRMPIFYEHPEFEENEKHSYSVDR